MLNTVSYLPRLISPPDGKEENLDWFTFETRMRRIIHELLEPTMSKASEDRNRVAQAEKMINDHGKRV